MIADHERPNGVIVSRPFPQRSHGQTLPGRRTRRRPLKIEPENCRLKESRGARSSCLADPSGRSNWLSLRAPRMVVRMVHSVITTTASINIINTTTTY